MFRSFFNIYLYIYLSIYIYIYIEKRMELSAFFCKRTKRSPVLLRSLQKNGTFFTFFSVLLKRTGKNIPLFWVSYISRQKLKKERERTERSERERLRCPTLLFCGSTNFFSIFFFSCVNGLATATVMN